MDEREACTDLGVKQRGSGQNLRTNLLDFKGWSQVGLVHPGAFARRLVVSRRVLDFAF